MKFFSLLTAGLLAVAHDGTAQTVPPIPTDSTVKMITTPKGFTSQLNVVYAKVGPWDGRMDLYLNPMSAKATPVVINIHGGGWNKGTKEAQSGFNSFFREGWAVANVEYRLSTYAPAPAAVEDIRCALIYLINNASKLNIDPDKIVIMGGSAGGHLALMGGLLANDHLFDTNCPTKEKVHVRAIIDKYGITDVGQWRSRSAGQWLGEYAKDEKFIRSVSPIYYVQKNSPPTLIVHGDADPVVPYEQSVALHTKLLAAGVKTELMTVPGGKHGGFNDDQKREMNELVIKFLKETGL